MINLKQAQNELKYTVEHFKQWVKSTFSKQQIKTGDIDDCSYPKWDELEDLCERIFTASIFDQLSVSDKEIVFIIGRQWDLGRILNWFNKGGEEIGHLGMTKRQLFELSQIAVSVDDTDAKGQFAASLFKVGDSHEVIQLLLNYHQDPDEYVRRQALNSLNKINYSDLDNLLAESWQYNEEFERMMCLELMAEINLTKTETWLADALVDEREYLQGFAVKLRAKIDHL